MPIKDASKIKNVSDAAKETGMASSVADAYLNN